jgi:hypothetical protein
VTKDFFFLNEDCYLAFVMGAIIVVPMAKELKGRMFIEQPVLLFFPTRRVE